MFLTPISDERTREEGFTLAALIVILTIIAIVIAYTVPTQWSISTSDRPPAARAGFRTFR